MKIHNVEQGSDEWFKVRSGKPTASCFDKIVTPTGQLSKSAEIYQNEIIAEILVGGPVESWAGNMWTERGNELEQDACEIYELISGNECETIGFVTDDKETMGCSPDRLVGKDGLLEIKCPKPSTHVANLLAGKMDKGYYPQVQGQMLVTGRKWVDSISYHPHIKPVIYRIERDDEYIENLSKAIVAFNAGLNEKLDKLHAAGAYDKPVDILIMAG